MQQPAVSNNTMRNMIPDQSHLPAFITFLNQYNLVFCTIHGLCLTYNDLGDHLKQAHNFAKAETSQAKRAARDLNVAIARAGINHPATEAPPIQGLEVRAGFKCAQIGCRFLSPQYDSLWSHLSKHGIHRADMAHGTQYHNVAIQNLFPGKRPYYIHVEPEEDVEPEESSTAGETAVGDEANPNFSDDDMNLVSNTIFHTKREHGNNKVHICLAEDIRNPQSDPATLNPNQLDFERYCNLLKSEGILDRVGQVKLVFNPPGGEKIEIINQMMFTAAITYQADRKADMITFTAVAHVQRSWFRFW